MAVWGGPNTRTPPNLGGAPPASAGSRLLLEWAKSREAQQAGLGLDQRELERFAKRVVHLFTVGYTTPVLLAGLAASSARDFSARLGGGIGWVQLRRASCRGREPAAQ